MDKFPKIEVGKMLENIMKKPYSDQYYVSPNLVVSVVMMRTKADIIYQIKRLCSRWQQGIGEDREKLEKAIKDLAKTL